MALLQASHPAKWNKSAALREGSKGCASSARGKSCWGICPLCVRGRTGKRTCRGQSQLQSQPGSVRLTRKKVEEGVDAAVEAHQWPPDLVKQTPAL